MPDTISTREYVSRCKAAGMYRSEAITSACRAMAYGTVPYTRGRDLQSIVAQAYADDVQPADYTAALFHEVSHGIAF